MRKRSDETTKQFVFRRAEKFVYRLVELQKSSNPKKNRLARRERNPIPSKRVVKYVSMSKYKPALFTTKKTKAA